MEDKFRETTLEREKIFSGKVIDVYVDKVLTPGNQESFRELVYHNGAVGVLAITKEDRIVLVRQFRKVLEKSIIEIPAGKIELGEIDPMETAKRELEEETFYRCEKIRKINEMVTSPGFCNETVHLYEASGLVKVDNPLPRDEDEYLDIIELSLEEAKHEIKVGNICDAKTMYAILYWELEKK